MRLSFDRRAGSQTLTDGEESLRDYLRERQKEGKIIYMSLHPWGSKTISRKPENLCKVEGHGEIQKFENVRESFYDYLVPLFDRSAIRKAEADARMDEQE